MTIDSKQLWENTLIDVELNISKANFTTWFKNTHIVKQEGDIVYIGVPSQFVKDWIFMCSKHVVVNIPTFAGLLDFTLSRHKG